MNDVPSCTAKTIDIMKRDIVFRGKDVVTGEWYYGDLEFSRYIGRAYIHTYNEDGIYCRQVEVDPDSVGQYTGLHDKNGKDIYEGDIVKHPYVDPIFGDLVEGKDGDGVTSEVVFHDGAFVVKYDDDDYIYLDAFTRHGHVEVVGNVFENNNKH